MNTEAILTTHPIACAVMPVKAEAVERAKKVAQDTITQVLVELEAHGWDLNKAAPQPAATMRRADYQRAKSTRSLYESLTKPAPGTDTLPWYRPGAPMIRVRNEKSEAGFVKLAGEEAAVQYDAFVLKLVAKADPKGECYGAKLDGSHVWGYSTLTVWRHNESAERWRTHTIVNVSKLGKVFNQWPTRKVK